MKSGKFETPFYFYDLTQVGQNYKSLQESLGPRFKIYYSMKANPHPSVLKYLLNLKSKLDISSQGEMNKALSVGFLPQDLSFVGPGKSRNELIEIVDRKIEYCVIESLQELEVFSEIAKERNQRPKICLRVNPKSFIKSTGAKAQSQPSHFGIDEDQLTLAVPLIGKHLQLAGLHFYLHSHFLNAEHIVANFSSFTRIANEMQKVFSTQFEILNFGGGFGIPYFKGQNHLDMNALKSSIDTFLKEPDSLALKTCQFCVESGRFIAGSSGYFVTRVLYKKNSYGKNIYVCDGGMSQHQAATGVGQIIKRNYPIKTLTQKALQGEHTTTSQNEPAHFVGPSCYSLDVLGNDIESEELTAGDFVILEQSGAYGPTFSPENFLSRNKASEYTNEA